VVVDCADRGLYRNCRTLNIGLDGSLIALTVPLEPGTRVQLELEDRFHGGRMLPLTGVVAGRMDGSVDIRFDPLSSEVSQALEEVIWPEWDGRDLLEGVMIYCDVEQVENLEDLLRLTTLVETRFRR
jgi:hypothetical protein